MKLLCGYLPNTPSSGYFYPIQTIKFWGIQWKKCVVNLDGKIIAIISNQNEPVHIDQRQTNDYSIELTVNGNVIHSQRRLFYVELDFDEDPEYELIESMIVDH